MLIIITLTFSDERMLIPDEEAHMEHILNGEAKTTGIDDKREEAKRLVVVLLKPPSQHGVYPVNLLCLNFLASGAGHLHK